MEFKILNPVISKNISESIEKAMIEQNVTDIKDLKWIITYKKLSKSELKKQYPNCEEEK